MGSIHEVLHAFRDAYEKSGKTDKPALGIKFEHLMVQYFQRDPVLSQEYDEVWRWIEWPGNNKKPDTGIDLVARTRDTGELTAIQCKFYSPEHRLEKKDIDSFFTELGRESFSKGVIISTTDNWGKHAESALEDQSKPVTRVSLADLADSPLDWQISWGENGPDVTLEKKPRHDPRPHQQRAIEKVFDGYRQGHDRGKLIMACGTGKTFTSLKIAERTATDNGDHARILFCVPSISLLSQTLKEWAAQSTMPLRAFAVCSDKKVSGAAKRVQQNEEDSKTYDVTIPVTTKPERLTDLISAHGDTTGLTVVFTTYQSLPVVAEAQKLGVPEFDLVLCDEAHRTTGVTLSGSDESHFVRVHDQNYLRARRRLYMTATPRIYDQPVKDKASEHSAVLASMDDETIYGPEFHCLSFGEAVDKGLLTDYKVLVLTVDQSVIAGPLQTQLAGHNQELNLDDASRIVGCWNGLAKRAVTTADGSGFPPGEIPMRRAVAFAKDIKTSKLVAEMFPRVVTAYRDTLDDPDTDTDTEAEEDTASRNQDLECFAEHVDGTFNALERHKKLAWLQAPLKENECRILTNARCLSEGVDVPSLDAVIFLHPRNSRVDVVQSVGRVMRKAPGKNYGYIILPVVVPAEESPSQALADNRRFTVVWDVLNALRSHDERFEAHVNALAFHQGADELQNGGGTDFLLGGHIGPVDTLDEGESLGGLVDNPDEAQRSRENLSQIALFSLSEWRDAIFARIVDKVGTRTYWEDWARDVAGISQALITRIRAALEHGGDDSQREFTRFVKGLRDNLNESISTDDAISMLSQHLITKPVFDALFTTHDFASHNPVSKVMQSMVQTLGGSGLESETNELEKFYHSVRVRASEVTSAQGKQDVIAELYERFFKIGFSKQAESLGIVYTPTPVVNWMVQATDSVSRAHLGRGLTEENVHIMDPFTGTGTFLTRLLQSGLISPSDITRKYRSELHANEMMLLAYYVAAVNIESTYHAVLGKTGANEYEPFAGIVLADTFQISEAGDSMDADMFPHNNDRITRQLNTDINIIMGNPPYSAGQKSENDNNANMRYPTLDKRIADTYARHSTAGLKRFLYDSYVRAFRWATTRIGQQGVVAFVTNGNWIDGNSADGMRHTLAQEYSHIYVYNLRGNQRTSGELARQEGGKIFGSGSRSTVAIFIGVKNPHATGPCIIDYCDIGDYLSREEKLRILESTPLTEIDWQRITPNEHADWINQRDIQFETHPVIGTKKPLPGHTPIFTTYSLGLVTNRDAWVYNFSRENVAHNVTRMIDFYQQQTRAFTETFGHETPKLRDTHVNDFINTDPTKISWTLNVKKNLARGIEYAYDPDSLRVSMYRPFTPQHVYFNRTLNESVYLLPSVFPTAHHSNIGFSITGTGTSKPFTTLMTRSMPDLSFWGSESSQFFPRYTYKEITPSSSNHELFTDDSDVIAGESDAEGWTRIDNITDAIHTLYCSTLGADITKDDIFYFTYGFLHSPAYREKHAADLKKMLPHIPTPQTRAEFDLFTNAGRTLSALHADYLDAAPYPLHIDIKPTANPDDPDTWRVKKMSWNSKTDHSAIVYNSNITIRGIPPEAEEYSLGSRTALGWILERYQDSTHKDSGIRNDPNDWSTEHRNPRHIVDLIQKVTTVAVETTKIILQLP